MKKVLLFMTMFAAAMSFTACGGDDDNNSKGGNSGSGEEEDVEATSANLSYSFVFNKDFFEIADVKVSVTDFTGKTIVDGVALSTSNCTATAKSVVLEKANAAKRDSVNKYITDTDLYVYAVPTMQATSLPKDAVIKMEVTARTDFDTTKSYNLMYGDIINFSANNGKSSYYMTPTLFHGISGTDKIKKVCNSANNWGTYTYTANKKGELDVNWAD